MVARRDDEQRFWVYVSVGVRVKDSKISTLSNRKENRLAPGAKIEGWFQIKKWLVWRQFSAISVYDVLLMNHAFQDAVSLELARHVAIGLRIHSEWLDVARANLERWSQRNYQAPSLLRCYDEWRGILERPLDEICAMLVAETDEGQRLRQNSPFTGLLSPAVVWEIKARLRHATPAA